MNPYESRKLLDEYLLFHYGTPEEVADFLAAYVDAGCRTFNVMAVTTSTERAIEGVAAIRERLAKLG